jgi:Family of unknown function (DUF6492)
MAGPTIGDAPAGPAGPALDVLVCAGRSDVGGLLASCLSLLFVNFEPLGRVHLITPETAAAERLLDRLSAAQRARISVRSDYDVCPEAAGMSGWFRQQYLKLNADRIVERERVVCLGADTLLLERVTWEDLLDPEDRPFVRYFRYRWPNQHLDFERNRVLNVARLLRIRPVRSFLLGDFVCDLFLVEARVLRGLREHLAERAELADVLTGLGARIGPDNRFGEWTVYAVFVLDVLAGSGVRVRAAEPNYFGQIHSQHDLLRADGYRCKIVHFAQEPGGTGSVLADLAQAGRLPAEVR